MQELAVWKQRLGEQAPGVVTWNSHCAGMTSALTPEILTPAK